MIQTPRILWAALLGSQLVYVWLLVSGSLAHLGFSPLHCAPSFAAGITLAAWRFPTEARFLGPVESALGRSLR